MHLLMLMLAGCAPQHAEIDGTFHSWLAKGSSATVREGDVGLDKATLIDCRSQVDDEITPEEGSVCAWGEPSPVDPDVDRPDYFRFTLNDVYYLLQGNLDVWRSEAIITSEGDFQLTLHHDLGNGQDFRFAFVIDPVFDPFICIQANQSCYVSGDQDGDGWEDAADPDCQEGGWEIGFTEHGCNNGLDDDGDGLVDIDDPQCTSAFQDESGSTCSDGEDNDGDGYSDGKDADCVFYGAEDGTTNELHACSDGLDNDGDGAIDADDDGCDVSWDNLEDGPTDDDLCKDDHDNDGDGWVDEDLDCDAFGEEAGLSGFACNDGLDNDGDGLIDAQDSGCVGPNDPLEDDYTDAICTDGTDNDGDGWEDDEDPDCVLGVAEDDTFYGLFACNDGLSVDTDDDAIDEDDRDCSTGMDNNEDDNSSTSSCTESANNDDDFDGWDNDTDPDCLLGSQELGHSGMACNDGLDNDGDGAIDADDSGCISPWRATEEDLPADTDCTDGLDNNSNAWVDAADPGCLLGAYESDYTTECSDGVDNDGDGAIDGATTTDDEGDLVYLEDGCSTWAFDTHEASTSSCADGLDNDGDGWADASDPDCANPGFERGFSSTLCADGVDNDGDGLVDGLDDGCSSALDPFEEDINECADGLDNDGDGWQDTADADCVLLSTPYEGNVYILSQCSDGTDNDGDGTIDALDEDCTSSLDNREDYEAPGDPVRFDMDYADNLTQWSRNEEGTLFFLNAGAYQADPSNDEELWVLPQEWLAGYGHAKFGSEEFDAYPGDYFWVGQDPENPDVEGYLETVAEYQSAAALWQAELGAYAGMEPADFEIKVEGNEWRPINTSNAGLDNWIETHPSWVLIDPGSDLTAGGSAKGTFQVYMNGYESASTLVIKGSFEVPEIKEDRWGYPVLEDEKMEQYNTVGCE